MTKTYRVLWTPVAQRDLESLLNFIAQDSLTSAKQILAKLRTKASQLTRFPQRGRTIPELAHIPGLPFRELVVAKWRIIYRVKDKQVEILACLDSRRDLEEALFERLSRL